ncbi:hypothetical protein ACH0CV_12815 [Brachybacterium paraconglomeratum]|uniref:GAP1-N2 domain-containing protein n=1 Tax=Brachybacterium paraconglomeratum TaxID=173362 RepID=UPI003879D251
MSRHPEQLLFGSVDLLIDGIESSGWQVIARSDGLEETAADDLVRWIEPELTTLRPLSGFPTEEEIRAADRRLVHRRIAGAPVLFHTAPAGQDTTGRPNTMTHVVVDRSENTMRPLLGPTAWRAPWWCTPFGPEQMRRAELPASDTLRPGTVVTDDSVLAHVLQPGAADALGALADVVARNAERTDEGQRELAVLVIDAVDDAAQWIGALLACTAVEPARCVAWSTLERAHGGRDLDRLRLSGLDIAAVPREDLRDRFDLPARCTVVDPSSPTRRTPETVFGRIVAAMAADPGLWLEAREAMDREVMSQLVDQSGVSLAWPGAMAQARAWLVQGDETVLFSRGYSGNLRSDVESVLLRASVPALEEALPGTAEALRAAKEALIGEAGQRTPQGWRELCLRIGDRLSPERALLLGRRYLDAAILDPDWLRRDRTGLEPLPGTVRTALAEWSAGPGGTVEAAALVSTASRTLEQGPPGQDPVLASLSAGTVRGRLVTGLLEDGVRIEHAVLDQLLAPLAQEILGANAQTVPSGHERQPHLEVVTALPSAAREVLAERLERGLLDRAIHEAQTEGAVRQPVLPPMLSLALSESASGGRGWLSVQVALGAISAGVGELATALTALDGAARRAQEVRAVLVVEPPTAAALEDAARVEHLPALSALESSGVPQASRWTLVAALADPEDARSVELLRERRRASRAIARARREPVTALSWEDSALLLAEAVASPFLTDTLTSGGTWAWAENAHVAAVQIRDGAEGLPESPQLRRRLMELAHRGEQRSAAVLVLLSVGSQRFSLEEVRTPVDLDALVAAAAGDPRGLLAPTAQGWGRAGLDALRTLAADTSTTPPGDLASAAAATLPAAPTTLWDAAASVLDARLRGAPGGDLPRLIDEARAEFRGDSPGWARAQRAVPSLKGSLSSRAERLGDIVKKNLNLLPRQRKEGRDG